jgi:hypothetical protein
MEKDQTLYPNKLYQDKIIERVNKLYVRKKGDPGVRTYTGFLRNEVKSFLGMSDSDLDCKIEEWLNYKSTKEEHNPEKETLQAIIGCVACMAEVEKLSRFIIDGSLNGKDLVNSLKREEIMIDGAMFKHSLEVLTCLGITIDAEREILKDLAKHGKKFAESVGRHDDELTHYLESLFQEFHKLHDRYPRNKEVVTLLKGCAGEDDVLIWAVDNKAIEWGGGKTKLTTLLNRCTKIRKKFNKKITVIGKP